MKDYKLRVWDLRSFGCSGDWNTERYYFYPHIRLFYFYYESRKRELKTRLIYEDRCDERFKN
jgi:hypothetical protein